MDYKLDIKVVNVVHWWLCKVDKSVTFYLDEIIKNISITWKIYHYCFWFHCECKKVLWVVRNASQPDTWISVFCEQKSYMFTEVILDTLSEEFHEWIVDGAQRNSVILAQKVLQLR